MTAMAPPAIRSDTGKFVPGVSGNPTGRPKHVRSLAFELTNGGRDVIEFYATVMSGAALPCAGRRAKQYPSVQQRLEAARELADRAFGKAIQVQELSGPDGGAIEHSVTETRELIARRIIELAPAVRDRLALGGARPDGRGNETPPA